MFFFPIPSIRFVIAIVGNLHFKHGVIKASHPQKFLVSAIFNGDSFVHDGDAVGVGDGRQFVSDD